VLDLGFATYRQCFLFLFGEFLHTVTQKKNSGAKSTNFKGFCFWKKCAKAAMLERKKKKNVPTQDGQPTFHSGLFLHETRHQRALAASVQLRPWR
jgi:hypothetical protein